MSIKETLEKIKPFYGLLILLTIASIFFSLGRLSAIENNKTPLKIEYLDTKQAATVVLATTTVQTLSSPGTTDKSASQDDGGPVIGSKSGKKYYFPWCGTVKRIKPENQVKFESIEKAKMAGFTPGGNCKGLK